jgi:hypothetical protein
MKVGTGGRRRGRGRVVRAIEFEPSLTSLEFRHCFFEAFWADGFRWIFYNKNVETKLRVV